MNEGLVELINNLQNKVGQLEAALAVVVAELSDETILVRRRKLSEDCIYPTQAHDTDAGHDLYAIEDVSLPFGRPVKVKTGLSLQLPQGYYCSIRDRSGLGSKGIHTLGGVIDCEYTGEYCVLLVNLNKHNPFSSADPVYKISKGEKIAQLVFAKVPSVIYLDEDFEETKRGDKGFGSSDKV